MKFAPVLLLVSVLLAGCASSTRSFKRLTMRRPMEVADSAISPDRRSGESHSVSHTLLQETVDHLIEKKIKAITMKQGLALFQLK